MSLNIEKVCCKKARSKNDKICDVCKAVLSIELNVAILGSGGVGKSQITVSYLGGKFYVKKTTIGDQEYVINIFDTAGQDEYKQLLPDVIRRCQCFVIVYDITDESTFKELDLHIKRLRQTKELEPISAIIVGNKCDLEDKRVVKFDEASEYATKKNYLYSEASAKSGTNIESLFQKVISDYAPKIVKKTEKKRRSGIFAPFNFTSTSSDD